MIKLEDLTYEQCVRQGLGPMVFPHRLGDERIRGLGDERIRGLEEERQKMKAVCMQNMQTQAQLFRIQEQAWLALTNAGIQPVLMKGFGLAQYYPSPEQRQWGDIDLYVGPEQYHPACAVMRATFPKALKFDEELDHYKHYNLIADGVSIEVHRMTMGMMHPRDVRRYARMEQYGMEHAVPIKYINTDKHACGAKNIDKEEKKNDIKNTESSVTDSNSIVTAPQSASMQASRQTDDPFRLTDTNAQYLSDDSDKNTKNISKLSSYDNDKNGYELRVPEVTFNALFVMLHSWEHMMHGGANLRQVCDLALLLKHEQEKIDKVRLKRWLKELRLMEVWQLYMYAAVEMFGLKAEEAPFYSAECKERAEALLNDIIEDKNIHNTADADINREKEKCGDSACCGQHGLSVNAQSGIVSELPSQLNPLPSDSVQSTESSPYKNEDLLSSEENNKNGSTMNASENATSSYENKKNKKENRWVRKWGTMRRGLRKAERLAKYSPVYARHMKAAVLLKGLTRLFAPDRRWE